MEKRSDNESCEPQRGHHVPAAVCYCAADSTSCESQQSGGSRGGSGKPSAAKRELLRITRVLWSARSRCVNPKVPNHHCYGGRGITFFEGWRGVVGAELLVSEIGPRPSRRYTLDRVNNDGNYEPGNVRWATRQQQNLNRRGYGALRLKPLRKVAPANENAEVAS